jgi:LuxR family transcriptional regulator, quorum-sensing system regulator BjaR1
MPSNERLDLSPEDRALIAAWATTFARRGLELCANDNPSTAHLTGRERQCLAWAAEGKSDWHIGEILSLAAPTIHMHIENARKKLGCRTRHQAALEAWRLGLLAN